MVVHGEVRRFALLADLQNTDDVGVADLRRDLELVAESLLELRVACIAGPQHLQGDGCVAGSLVPLEDPGKCTLADQAVDGVVADGPADQMFRI